MPRETEKHSLMHLTIGGKQTGGPSPGEGDPKNLEGSLKVFSQDGDGVMSFLFFDVFGSMGSYQQGFAPTW